MRQRFKVFIPLELNFVSFTDFLRLEVLAGVRTKRTITLSRLVDFIENILDHLSTQLNAIWKSGYFLTFTLGALISAHCFLMAGNSWSRQLK